MPGINVKDVDQQLLTKALAHFLKMSGKIIVPEEMLYIKTGKQKEMCPDDADWFFTRCASILRHMYYCKSIGVGALTKIFGSRYRKGNRPACFSRASRGLLRKGLQTLEEAGLIEMNKEGGRKLSNSGRRDMDCVANQIYKKKSQTNRCGVICISGN